MAPKVSPVLRCSTMRVQIRLAMRAPTSWVHTSVRYFLPYSMSNDTTASIWNGEFNLAGYSIHTLFLAGDTTLLTRYLQWTTSHTIQTGIALLEYALLIWFKMVLSIAVDIQGNPQVNGNLIISGISKLAHLGLTLQIVLFPEAIAFEIRTQGSDSLLLHLPGIIPVYKSHTVIIAGTFSNPNYPITPFSMNNY